jgi:3-oxoacyl-[acyl-carrier-protein] synthase-1
LYVRDVYVASDNIITSLGFSTAGNACNMLENKSGICLTENDRIAPYPFYYSLVDSDLLDSEFRLIDNPENFTRFEQISICSVKNALSATEIDCTDPRSLYILSTTKGNIDILEAEKRVKYGQEKAYLWNAARTIRQFFNFSNEAVVISNACISGVQAIITGARLIQAGYYDNVVINGTDIISEFVLSGFNSFKSLSTGPCRPFDKTRDGLSLGEGSGTIILTSNPSLAKSGEKIMAIAGCTTNDANHISGPSRTGEGLFLAINKIMKKTPARIDFISAHGTGTIFNDDMESVAITRAGLQSVPVNGFKGFWGHTLGAAGIIESVMAVYSLRKGVLINTLGCSEMGLTNPLNIITKATKREINTCLKIASGFGGCNAALLFFKK